MSNPLAATASQADPGLWQQVLCPGPADRSRPALFLDRDGVIVDEVDYLHRVEDVRLIDGAADTIRACNDAGCPVIVVTNQSGVGRGYYGWDDFAAVQSTLIALLDAAGARIDMVLACAYHAEALPPYDIANHPWRKPNPGMLLAATIALNIDCSRSWIVGDAVSDIAAGAAAGLAGGVHVMTGHGRRDRDAVLGLNNDGFEVAPAITVGEVPALIIGHLRE
jgi:D-glycero-D-manno-heptose 1,7-bisphosphate phosphatase